MKTEHFKIEFSDLSFFRETKKSTRCNFLSTKKFLTVLEVAKTIVVPKVSLFLEVFVQGVL